MGSAPAGPGPHGRLSGAGLLNRRRPSPARAGPAQRGAGHGDPGQGPPGPRAGGAWPPALPPGASARRAWQVGFQQLGGRAPAGRSAEAQRVPAGERGLRQWRSGLAPCSRPPGARADGLGGCALSRAECGPLGDPVAGKGLAPIHSLARRWCANPGARQRSRGAGTARSLSRRKETERVMDTPAEDGGGAAPAGSVGGRPGRAQGTRGTLLAAGRGWVLWGGSCQRPWGFQCPWSPGGSWGPAWEARHQVGLWAGALGAGILAPEVPPGKMVSGWHCALALATSSPRRAPRL